MSRLDNRLARLEAAVPADPQNFRMVHLEIAKWLGHTLTDGQEVELATWKANKGPPDARTVQAANEFSASIARLAARMEADRDKPVSDECRKWLAARGIDA